MNNNMDKKTEKSPKKLNRSQTNKYNLEDTQLQKNDQSKYTIQNFEKVLITEQQNNKSQKNFFGSKEIKAGNR
jgi:hypothetical protein